MYSTRFVRMSWGGYTRISGAKRVQQLIGRGWTRQDGVAVLGRRERYAVVGNLAIRWLYVENVEYDGVEEGLAGQTMLFQRCFFVCFFHGSSELYFCSADTLVHVAGFRSLGLHFFFLLSNLFHSG